MSPKRYHRALRTTDRTEGGVSAMPVPRLKRPSFRCSHVRMRSIARPRPTAPRLLDQLFRRSVDRTMPAAGDGRRRSARPVPVCRCRCVPTPAKAVRDSQIGAATTHGWPMPGRRCPGRWAWQAFGPLRWPSVEDRGWRHGARAWATASRRASFSRSDGRGCPGSAGRRDRPGSALACRLGQMAAIGTMRTGHGSAAIPASGQAKSVRNSSKTSW